MLRIVENGNIKWPEQEPKVWRWTQTVFQVTENGATGGVGASHFHKWLQFPPHYSWTYDSAHCLWSKITTRWRRWFKVEEQLQGVFLVWPQTEQNGFSLFPFYMSTGLKSYFKLSEIRMHKLFGIHQVNWEDSIYQHSPVMFGSYYNTQQDKSQSQVNIKCWKPVVSQ